MSIKGAQTMSFAAGSLLGFERKGHGKRVVIFSEKYSDEKEALFAVVHAHLRQQKFLS